MTNMTNTINYTDFKKRDPKIIGKSKIINIVITN